MNVTGKTKALGIFGFPVEHTLSPAIHNAAFEALGLDMCYLPFKVSPEDLLQAVNAVRALNILGVNITVPHKEKVIPLLDEVDEEARFIGAVNTVVNKNGRLKGYNTDGRGFINSLSENNISAEGKEILILGAGGASRAISYYLSEAAKKLFLYDLDTLKTEKLVNDLKKIRNNVFAINDIREVKNFDIVINATPLGLKPDDPMPLSTDLITSKMIVCDLIYKQTKFLKHAEAKGAKTLDGSGMLLWQGVLAFELWTGLKPPVDTMRKALLERIG
ncbi:MAG: shikimate dehydrogenase [Nitrospirae bacterium]|nr:shikimate dehydrogenase [Nitrospirota bacterium]